MRRPALAFALCAIVAASAAAELGPYVELAGAWALDDKSSDDFGRDLNAVLEGLAKDLRPPSQRPGGAASAKQRRRATRSSLARDLFGPIRVPGQALAIDVQGEAVTFARLESLHGAGVETEAPVGGRFPALPRLRETERVFTDGRASIVDADNPDVRRGAWEDGVLWIERSGSRGTRVVEAWSLEGPVLRIDYEIRNALLEAPVSFTLRYVRPQTP